MILPIFMISTLPGCIYWELTMKDLLIPSKAVIIGSRMYTERWWKSCWPRPGFNPTDLPWNRNCETMLKLVQNLSLKGRLIWLTYYLLCAQRYRVRPTPAPWTGIQKPRPLAKRTRLRNTSAFTVKTNGQIKAKGTADKSLKGLKWILQLLVVHFTHLVDLMLWLVTLLERLNH